MSPVKQETLHLKVSTYTGCEVTIEACTKQLNSGEEEANADLKQLTNISISEGSFLKNHVLPIIPNLKLITVLKLQNCSLIKLSTDIHLLQLTELDVSKNLLTSVPECIYLGLSGLQCLNLSNNKISEFTESPMCARTIEKINLCENLMKELPPWIFTEDCNLGELLYCSNHQICSLKGDKVKTLNHSVNRLEIQNCQIVDQDLFYLKLFGKLSYLDIGNETKVKSNYIDSLEDMFNLLNLQAYLKVLMLNKLGIPEISSNIRNLSDLRELYMEHNNLTILPEELVMLDKLQIFKVGHNRIYELPANFNKLRNLQIIEAQFNFLANVDFRNMPALVYADLYHNDLSDVYLDGNRIEMIDLECNYVTDLDNICKDYTEKRDRLRERNGLTFSRNIGCLVEKSISERSECPSRVESNLSEDNEINEFVEEENWDDEYNHDFGEVTLSDSEYRGDVISEQRSGSCEPVNDSTFDYLYEDAD